jgi:hypothetical protein
MSTIQIEPKVIFDASYTLESYTEQSDGTRQFNFVLNDLRYWKHSSVSSHITIGTPDRNVCSSLELGKKYTVSFVAEE